MMANVAKKLHKDKSESENEIKKRKYEESSEEEEEEEEDEKHDEEEEVEMDEVRHEKDAPLPAGPAKWSTEESHQLLISILMCLPPCDVEPYSEQEAKIDWGRVAFGSFRADQCRDHYHQLIQKVRLYRTMGDLVIDALSLISQPKSSFQMIQKNNQRLALKAKEIKKKSKIPKLVMNAFSLFMQETIKSLSHMPSNERMKECSHLYKLLSEEEKKELMDRYEELKKNHIKVLKKLKEDDPALAEEVDTQLRKLEKTPGKSKKPKVSVINQNNSILKYMKQEKASPAPTAGGLERKQRDSSKSPKKSATVKSLSTVFNSKNNHSDDDSTKTSESKPQSNGAAEEEDSSVNEEESNLSPKKSSSVKTATKPKKFKAVVEKPVSDHDDSEDQEHEQRPNSPKKSSSALTVEATHEKLSKISKQKKKKKKGNVVTGLSQFVTAKRIIYQLKYPELNEREIAKKLARKWERLSDMKKNKYEKLAMKKMSSEEVD